MIKANCKLAAVLPHCQPPSTPAPLSFFRSAEHCVMHILCYRFLTPLRGHQLSKCHSFLMPHSSLKCSLQFCVLSPLPTPLHCPICMAEHFKWPNKLQFITLSNINKTHKMHLLQLQRLSEGGEKTSKKCLARSGQLVSLVAPPARLHSIWLVIQLCGSAKLLRHVFSVCRFICCVLVFK